MGRIRIRNLIKDEKGSGLVLTLMVLLVLSVLGTSVGMVTVGSYRLSDANKDSTSAYYIAEAGAERAYNEIQTQILTAYDESSTKTEFENRVKNIVESLDGKVYSDFDSQKEIQPKAIIKTAFDKSKIHSIGVIDKQQREVNKPFTVKWEEKGKGGDLPSTPGDTALIAKNRMRIVNGIVEGHAYIDTTKHKSIELRGSEGGNNITIVYPHGVLLNDIVYHPEGDDPSPKFVQKTEKIHWDEYNKLLSQVKIPTINNKLQDYTYEFVENQYTTHRHKLIDNGSIKMNSWLLSEYTINLTKDIYIPKIDIASEKTLKFNPNGGSYTIKVDDLNIVSGSLDIVGKGKVTLIVSGKMTYNQPSKINETGKSNQLTLIYTGKTPNFSEITMMNGHIISVGNTSEVIVKNSGINGVLLTDAKKIKYIGGNSDRPSQLVVVAPFGEVVLTEGYRIQGQIIADMVTTDGGGTITYKEIDSSGFFEGTLPIENDGNNKDIIQSEPALEVK